MSGAGGAVLDRFLAGECSAEIALMQLFLELRSAARVAALLAAQSAAHPEGVRLAPLRAALAANPQAEEAVAVLLASGLDHDRADGEPAAAIARLSAGFDRAVAAAPEASVALYSLGRADLLAAATDEIVTTLGEWGLLRCGERVLDLGCGIGRFAPPLAARGCSYLGTDIAAGMIAEARRRHGALAGVRFARVSGADLSALAGERFDLVLAVDAFPYLVQAGSTVAARHVADAAQLLSPGGTLAILNFSYRGDPARDEAELRALAAVSGFAVARVAERPFALWDGRAFLLARPR